MRNVQMLAVLTAVSGLAGPAVQGATIQYIGADSATGANWRVSAAKLAAFSKGGNTIYGSDGYYVVTNVGWDVWNNTTTTKVQTQLPAYISAVTNIFSSNSATHAGTTYGNFNDPSASSQPTNTGAGAWYKSYGVGTAGTNKDTFTITLSQTAHFELGFLGLSGANNGGAGSTQRLEVRQTIGGSADSGMQNVNGGYLVNRSPVYDFFEISGNAGDQFTVTAPVAASGSLFQGGMTFDSIPEPASLPLLGVIGITGTMVLQRRRALAMR